MFNKKWLTACLAVSSVAISSAAFSLPCSGIYLGAQLGWGNTDYSIDKAFRHHGLKEPGEDGFAGRVYMGYQFNRYLGLETGLTAFSEVDLPENFGDLQTLQWDLLARVGTPFGDTGFRGDVKFGAAEIYTDFDAGQTAKNHNYWDNSRDIIRPVAGASLSYVFPSNVSMDLSYLHGFGDLHGDNKHFAPNTDLVTLGVSMLFGR